MTVELRFKAAEATNPPAPRVEEGIIHGITGFVDAPISLGGAESMRSIGSC